MSDIKTTFKNYWQAILLAIVAIGLLTIISAMGGDARQVGSSYSIAANGYSSWYEMMSERGANIRRWQKSFTQLTRVPEYATGTTLLQVNPELARSQLTTAQQEWVKKGNRLVILGITAPAWDTSFQSDLDSDVGKVRIETTRRFDRYVPTEIGLDRQTPTQRVLGDRFGSAIERFTLVRVADEIAPRYPRRAFHQAASALPNRGEVIVATTPHLAANAYQDFRPNYELLAQLVGRDRRHILVDEFIHGYIDREAKSDLKNSDAIAYFTGTPLVVVLVNLVLGILVFFWQQNRRFGKVFIPKPPEIDNSEAYIQALSGVLRQANSSEFLLQKIGRAKLRVWEQRLGLETGQLVEPDTPIAAWEERMKLPSDDLRFVLESIVAGRRLSPAELTIWLNKVRTIDRQLGISDR